MNDLLAQVLVRHRGPGHLRLELPPALRGEAVNRYLARGLEGLAGVRRVRVDPAQGKLAIHYQETMVNDRRIAQHLAGLLRDLTAYRDAPPPPPVAGVRERLLALPPVRAARARYALWRARAAAARVLLGQQMAARPALQVFGKDPETAAIHFINEVITFYLIKTHWSRITQLWLRHPLVHYKEWLAVSYLLFLLVRSRKTPGGTP